MSDADWQAIWSEDVVDGVAGSDDVAGGGDVFGRDGGNDESEGKDVFGNDVFGGNNVAEESADPGLEIPVAEGPERDPLRAQLWNLAADELRQVTESWQKKIAEQEAPLSACARDLIAMEVTKKLELLRREERSCFREFSRLTSDLLKLQKASEVRDQKPKAKNQEQQPQVQDAGAQADRAAENENEGAAAMPSTADASAGAGRDDENEGASGYVEENTHTVERSVVTASPLPVGQPHLAAVASHDAAMALYDNVTELNAIRPPVPLIRGSADPRR
jgi:hypothetical protein